MDFGVGSVVDFVCCFVAKSPISNRVVVKFRRANFLLNLLSWTVLGELVGKEGQGLLGEYFDWWLFSVFFTSNAAR